ASTIVVSGSPSAIDASVSLGNGNRDVYLTPNVTLPDGQVVTVTIAGVTDLSGNAVGASATQFSVAAGPDITPPIVQASNPANGLGGVPTNVIIAIRVDEPLDPSTVNSGTFLVYDNALGQQVAGVYTVSSDGRTISFVPSAPLAVNRAHSVYIAYSGLT